MKTFHKLLISCIMTAHLVLAAGRLGRARQLDHHDADRFISNLARFISVELAGTGIGRGDDSVGHAAGTYRNRMRVQRLNGD